MVISHLRILLDVQCNLQSFERSKRRARKSACDNPSLTAFLKCDTQNIVAFLADWAVVHEVADAAMIRAVADFEARVAPSQAHHHVFLSAGGAVRVVWHKAVRCGPQGCGGSGDIHPDFDEEFDEVKWREVEREW